MTAIVTPEVQRSSIERDHYQMIINGQQVDAASGESFDTYNPARGQHLATVAKAGPEDVDRAVAAARASFDKWSRMASNQRARIMIKIADLLRERTTEIAHLEVLNNGKAIQSVKAEINQAIDDFEFFAGAATKIMGTTLPLPGRHLGYTLREPVGVCGQIIPWNYPLMMAAWKLAPALACGNTIVLKPASATPLTALILGEICLAAGVPAGVVNVITGPGDVVGSYLASHPDVDKIAFTGETGTGKLIATAAAGTIKRVTLELGGKSANVVFEDADIEAAANAAAFSIYYSAGQSCEARSRLLVHESVHDQFLEYFVARVQKIKVGDPMDPTTQVGSLISQKQWDVVNGYVQQGQAEGAKLLTGGQRPAGMDDGYFYLPTALHDVKNSMSVAQEEIFGPVLVIIPFKDEKEAIQLANDSIYGLAGTIWTNNLARAHRVAGSIRTGHISVNSPFTAFPGIPFGGYKQSGYGREMSLDAINLYTELKSVLIYTGEKPLNPYGN